MNFRNRASWIGDLVATKSVSITFETGLLFLHRTYCELKEPGEQGSKSLSWLRDLVLYLERRP